MKKITILICFGLLYSCTDFDRPKQLEKIDKLLVELEELEAQSTSINIDSVQLILDSMTEVERRVKKYYKDDTLTITQASSIDQIRKLNNKLFPLLTVVTSVNNEVINLRNSISDLRRDIENSTGDRAHYEQNIEFEEEKVEEIRQLIEKHSLTWQGGVHTYNEFHEDVMEFSKELELKNKEQYLIR